MSRRKFLGILGAALGACVSPSSPSSPSSRAASSSGVRAVAFDLFTLFDPRGVDRRVAELLGPQPQLVSTWKTRLFEYSWLRAAAGQYRDFEGLVGDSLSYAARAHALELSPGVRARLASAFVELDAWPDTAPTLDALRARGLRLVPLANFSPRMIESLLGRAGLIDRFEALVSTDGARSYKPDPRAYVLAERSLGLPRRQIAFAAFGAWDAAGGAWFGFPTFWVNRLAQPAEELARPAATGPDLVALADWLASAPS